MPDKPNIVFIFSDQHRGDTLGAAGNTAVITPNLDRIAAEGVQLHPMFDQLPLVHAGQGLHDDRVACESTRRLE